MLRFSVVILQALSVLGQSESGYSAWRNEGVNVETTLNRGSMKNMKLDPQALYLSLRHNSSSDSRRSSLEVPTRCVSCVRDLYEKVGHSANICKCMPCLIDPKKDFLGMSVSSEFRKKCKNISMRQIPSRRNCMDWGCSDNELEVIRAGQDEPRNYARQGPNRMEETNDRSSFRTPDFGRCIFCVRRLYDEEGDRMNICKCGPCWVNEKNDFFQGKSVDEMFNRNCPKSSRPRKPSRRNCMNWGCSDYEFEVRRTGRKYSRNGLNRELNKALKRKTMEVPEVESTMSPALNEALANRYYNRYQRPSYRFAGVPLLDDYRSLKRMDDAGINVRLKKDEVAEITMRPSLKQYGKLLREREGYTPETIVDFISIGSLTFEDSNPKPDWYDEHADAFEDQMDDEEDFPEDSAELKRDDSDLTGEDNNDKPQETTQQPDMAASHDRKSDPDDEMKSTPEDLDENMFTTMTTGDTDEDLSTTPNPIDGIRSSKLESPPCEKRSSRFRRSLRKMPTKKKGSKARTSQENTKGNTTTSPEKEVTEASPFKRAETISNCTTEATTPIVQLNTSSTDNSPTDTERKAELTTSPESPSTESMYDMETTENMSNEQETSTESVSRATDSGKKLKKARKSKLKMSKPNESDDGEEETTTPSISTRSDRFLRQTNCDDLKLEKNDTRSATETVDNSKERNAFVKKKASPRYVITLEEDQKGQAHGSGSDEPFLKLRMSMYEDFESEGVHRYMTKRKSANTTDVKDGVQNYLSKLISTYRNSGDRNLKKEPRKKEFPKYSPMRDNSEEE